MRCPLPHPSAVLCIMLSDTALHRNNVIRPGVAPCLPASRWLIGRLFLGVLAAAGYADLARSEQPEEPRAATERLAEQPPPRLRERFRFAGERSGLWPKSWPRLRGSSAAGIGG